MKDVYMSDNVEQGRNISKYIHVYVSICNSHFVRMIRVNQRIGGDIERCPKRK